MLSIRSSDKQKSPNSKFRIEFHLNRWWQKGLVFKIARKKIQEIFLASNYDIIGKFITGRGNSALNSTRKPISHKPPIN